MYQNPYQDRDSWHGKWYKVNFHTHAGTGPNTCGVNPIDRVVQEYKQIDFEALCISNHDLYTETSSFTDEDILMIPGVECSNMRHILTIGVNKSFHQLEHQAIIDETNKQGGFAVLCHPNWTIDKHWKIEEILKLDGYAGIEIANMVVYRFSGSGLATDVWDAILSSGKLTYGFGSDDFHQFSDAGRSYNYIYSTHKSVESIIKAVKAGQFCVSTGLVPDYFEFENGTIKVKANYPKETFIDRFTYRFIGDSGRVVSEQTGSAAQYNMSEENYVRVEVVGEHGAFLFFQPIWRSDALI